ncbi:MAG TPA: DUF5668 domain-containing protein [Trueperaceae bacterium]|nr:DUF5668 domain-containing protein [Trueperaceae bacterium]
MTTRNGAQGGPAYRPVAVWPLVLIAGGVVLFAANFGWLRWDALWSVWYLWPLVVIAVGVDVLLRGQHRLLVVIGTLLVGAAIYAGTSGSLGGGALLGSETISQGLEGASRAQVKIGTGVTRLVVRGDPATDLLVAGTVTPLRGETIERSFEVVGGVARFTIDSESRFTTVPFGRGGVWELTLSGRVPLTLDVDTGVGAADLDLSGLTLERLELSTGVGASTVTLPPGDYAAAIDTGVGAATIRIPAGAEARVTVSRGIGAISVPSGFEREGDVYVSEGYASARERIDLSVDSGVGAVSIVRFR